MSTVDPAALVGLPPLGAIIDGKYRLEAYLGKGGMAAVYDATQLLTQRRVAIKWLLPHIARHADVVERFLREARAAASLDHPSVVAIFDVGRADGSFFMVMERLVGESLRQRIQRGPLALEETLRFTMPLLGALAAAHDKGIIHRDLKPENIFLRIREDGSYRAPKVLDFGISKLTREESITLTGSLIGTPYYLSPEQLLGDKSIGPSSDVYQMGVLMYEMLSGRIPFDRPNYESLLIAILEETPPKLASLRPDLPPAVIAIVEKAMARDRAQRTQSMRELAHALSPHTDWIDEELRSAPHAAMSPQLIDAMAATMAVPTPHAAVPTPYAPASQVTASTRIPMKATPWRVLGVGVAVIVGMIAVAAMTIWLGSESTDATISEAEAESVTGSVTGSASASASASAPASASVATPTDAGPTARASAIRPTVSLGASTHTDAGAGPQHDHTKARRAGHLSREDF